MAEFQPNGLVVAGLPHDEVLSAVLALVGEGYKWNGVVNGNGPFILAKGDFPAVIDESGAGSYHLRVVHDGVAPEMPLFSVESVPVRIQ